MLDATFFATVGLVLFFVLLAKLGVHTKLLGFLDKRAVSIENELAEARRLREEAQSLLAEYQRKREAAEKEAENIVASAKAEAQRLAENTRIAMQDAVARRTKMAEDKIALAEADALKQVKTAASLAAITAAENILKAKVQGGTASDILDKAISDVAERLN
jgi:F-type H+-transporting ATPase subunit b